MRKNRSRRSVSQRSRRSNRRPNTGQIVISAVKKLMQNTGWTARTIIKFIKLEYMANDPRLSRKVASALKRGVRLGIFDEQNGRYKLSEKSLQPANSQEFKIMQRFHVSRASPIRVRERPSSTDCDLSSEESCRSARRRN